MTSFRTALARHRSLRARIRDERALSRATASAPGVEAVHEIATLSAQR